MWSLLQVLGCVSQKNEWGSRTWKLGRGNYRDPQPRKKPPLTRMKNNYLKNATVAIFQQPELLYPPDPPLGLRSFVETMWPVEPLPRASYSDKKPKKKELSAATDTVLLQQCMLCNNAKRIGMGEPYMGGAWGGYRSSSCHQGNWGGIGAIGGQSQL